MSETRAARQRTIVFLFLVLVLATAGTTGAACLRRATEAPTVTPAPVQTVTPTPGAEEAPKTPTNAPAAPDWTTVGEGETLAAVAERLGVTTQALALLNDVRPEQVQPGDELIIPNRETRPEMLAPADYAWLGHDSGAGEMEVGYPSQMTPGSSKTVKVSIYVPEDLKAPAPNPVVIVTLPVEVMEPIAPGGLKYLQYVTPIVVTTRMTVTLSSTRLQVTPLMPDAQEVNIYAFNQPTVWAWEIVAPETVGEYNLSLQVVAEAEERFVRTLSLETQVLNPTPTPGPATAAAPAPEATPTLTFGAQARQEIARRPVELISALLGFIGTLAGILVGVRAGRIKKLEGEIQALRAQQQAQDAPKAELERLRKVPFWKFWAFKPRGKAGDEGTKPGG